MDASPSPARPNLPLDVTPWPRSAQVAMALLLLLAVILLACNAYGYLPWSARPAELHPAGRRIDLNRAGEAELRQLPGVGPQLAGRIDRYRRDHGGFRSVEELGRVPGVGPATLARLRPYVSVEDGEEAEPAEPTVPVKYAPPAEGPSAATAPPVSKKAASLTERIDVNRAGSEQLQKLPGIGPKLSQRILEERNKAPFKSVDDLRRVPGIGPKTLDKLRPHVTVGEPEHLADGTE